MSLAATLVALAGASVLLWAGLEKARDPRPTAATLKQLGIHSSLGAWTLISAEVVFALALVFRPDSTWTQVGVGALAGAFALAGALALVRGQHLRCTCFGRGGSSELGTAQIVALLPWLAGVALVAAADLPRPSSAVAASEFAFMTLGMAAARFAANTGVWRGAREDRIAAQETYAWLRR